MAGELKKVITVDVYQGKNVVKNYGFMAGDKNTPCMEVKFRDKFGVDSLEGYLLRFILVDNSGSLVADEVTINSENVALVRLPNALFEGSRKIKIQLAIVSLDGEQVANINYFVDSEIRRGLAEDGFVEPVYELMLTQLVEEGKRQVEEIVRASADAYIPVIEKELQEIGKTAIAELEVHATEKKSELNQHTEEKKVVIDGYVDDKFQNRLAGVEVFNMFDKPNTKLKSVLGVQHGRFGYWDRDSENPTNIELAQNWQDNGVFSDLPKPVVLDNGTMHMDIDYDEYIEPADEIAENDLYRVVKSTKGHIELTRYHTEIVEEEEVRTSETRYHEWVYYSADEVLVNFEELWSNSWLWEEVQLQGDYEVVINRKHNEIVLGKVKERIQYEYDGDLKEAVTWEHKYLPFYPYLSTQDLLDQFDEFWELEPYVMSARAVLTGDYEIAGQVLEDRLDLGEGYENLVAFGKFSTSPAFRAAFRFSRNEKNKSYFDVEANSDKEQQISLAIRILTNYNSSNEYDIYKNPESLYISYKKTDKLANEVVRMSGTSATISKNDTGTHIQFYITNISGGDGFGITVTPKIWTNGDVLEIEDFIIIKNFKDSIRYIYGSRPDSKLALPQLAQLGAVTSNEMIGNHLVAQHENGTAIIKDAKVNPNAPLSSLHWGIQAYKDASGNKRLFVSTADGTYPVGWENIKYDADGVFYDVGRTSTSNNIVGYITNDNKVYVGNGYDNLAISNRTYDEFDVLEKNGYRFKITPKNIANPWFGVRMSNLEVDSTYTISVKLIDAEKQFDGIAKIVSNFNGQVFDTFFSKKGELLTLTKTTGSELVGVGIAFAVMSSAETASDKGWFEIEIQITKTSTPRPFSAGVVPDGIIKLVPQITTTDYSFAISDCDFDLSQSTTAVVSHWNSAGGEYFERTTQSTDDGFIYASTSHSNVRVNQAGIHNTRELMTNYWNSRPLSSFGRFLIYKGNLHGDALRAELAKDIYLPTYHHQSNSIINTYGITGMGAMYLYQPALTSAEIDEELEKDVYLPKTQWGIPNYKGE